MQKVLLTWEDTGVRIWPRARKVTPRNEGPTIARNIRVAFDPPLERAAYPEAGKYTTENGVGYQLPCIGSADRVGTTLDQKFSRMVMNRVVFKQS
jgi:hypothetical protein